MLLPSQQSQTAPSHSPTPSASLSLSAPPCSTFCSTTVAPAQTLTDKEYQRLRDASLAIIREMGVECGGSNVQMAINPEDGEGCVCGGVGSKGGLGGMVCVCA